MLSLTSGIPESTENPLMEELFRPAYEAEAERAKKLDAWRTASLDSLDRAVLDPDSFFAEKPINLPDPAVEALGGLPAVRQTLAVQAYLQLANDGNPIPGGDLGPELFREKLARERFQGRGAESDSAFFTEIQKESQGRRDTLALAHEMQATATAGALLRETSEAGLDSQSFQLWRQEAKGKPGYQPGMDFAYMEAWRDTQTALRQNVEPYLGPLKQVWNSMQSGGADWYSAWEQVPAENRDQFMASLAIMARALPADKQPAFWNNLTTQARRDIQGQAINVLEGIGGALNTGSPLNDYDPMGEQAAATLDRTRKNFIADVERIRNETYDPVKVLNPDSAILRTLERGAYAAPGAIATSAAALVPYAGPAATYYHMEESAYRDMRRTLMDGGMSDADASATAEGLAPIVAIPQAALERIGAGALVGKLPGLEKVLAATANRITSTAGRYAARTAAIAGFETAIENTQDLIPNLLQDAASALEQDVPGVVWKNGKDGFFDGYWEKTATTAVAILPLAIIGGAGGLSAEGRARAFAEAPDLHLRVLGISPDGVARIRAAQAQGRFQAEQAIEAELAARDPQSEDAMDATQELAESFQAEKEAVAAASDNGIMPRAVRGTDGTWTLYDTATGTEIGTAPDWQRAAQLATTHANFSADQDADRIALVFSTYQAAEVSGQWGTDTNRPTEINLDLGRQLTAQQAAAESASARERVAAQERLMGGDGSGTNVVLGQSRTELAQGQLRTVNRILEGGSVLDVFHEETHGFRRQAHARGILTREDDVAFVNAVNTVLKGRTTREGQPLQLLPENFETLSESDQETALDEAISAIAEAEVVRTRKGSSNPQSTIRNRQLPAGLVSNNLSALARLLGDRLLGKFRSFIAAIREYFGLAIDRAAQIQRGLADGTLDAATYEGYLAKLLGVDEQIDYDQQARDAEAAILDGAELAPMMDGDPFSLGQRTTVTPNASTRAFPGAEGSPSVIGPASFSIRAFHGTPHQVDKFTTEKIGTGEGAQAYGWGLYFAEAQEVASSYRKAGRNLGIIKDGDGQWWTTDGPKTIAGPFATSREAEAVAEAPAGNLYTVTLKVEDDQLLDWDKPLRQQPEPVKAALRRGYEEQGLDYPENAASPKEGQYIYKDMVAAAGGMETLDASKASAFLAELGIRGIRFLDGNSRGKSAASIFQQEGRWNVIYNDPANGLAIRTDTFDTEAEAKALVDALPGSYNYVIFDEADIEILEENGQPVAPSFSLGSRPVASAHNHIAQTLQANDAGGYATAVETDPLEGGKVRTIAKLFHRMFKPAERIDFNRHWKGSKKNFEPGQEKKFNADVSRSAGRVLEVLRLAHAMFPNFQSWYETRIKMALDIFGEMDPDAAKPENNFILRVLLAVTSNGNTVKEQTEDSWKVYQSWKSTGKMGGVAVRGTRAAEIGKALGRMDLLIESHGWEKMDQFLARTGTVKELRQTLVDDFGFTAEEAAKLTTGELIDEQVPFALIFGAKLGSFFNNLSGNFDTTTMDRWFMRTFARAMGMQLLPVDKADIQEKRDRLQSALAAARSNPEAALILKAAGVRANAPANQKTTVALADYFEKAANRENLNSEADELRLAVNGLYKIEDGFQLVEAPQSGGHRRFIRLAMGEARTTFSKESGKDWNAAELQALLWYFEKSVHEAYGSKQRDQSPDYGSAANELFRGRNGADARAFKPSDAVRRGKLEGGSMGLMGGQNAAGQEVAPSFSLGSRRLGVLTQDSIRRIQNPLRRAQAMERVSRKLEELRLEAERLELLSGTKRLKRSLAREAAIRQALRREELENEAWARHAAILSDDDLTKLRGQPLHSFFGDPSSPLRGRLMSKTAALKKHPDLFTLHNPGDYDGSEAVSRTVFGGDLAPDQAAQEAFDAGLIKEPTTDALWQALESESRHVASMKKVLESAKADLREARTVAKAETNAWLATQTDQQAATYSPRQEILRSLAALDAILSSVPAEIRGKVGGWVQAARIADPDAGLQFLRERLAKVDVELEKWLKSQYNLEFLALLDRARPEKDEAGKRPRGKIGADVHSLFADLREAMTLTAAETEAEATRLEILAEQEDLTPEQQAHAMLQANLVRLVGDWPRASAARREAAVLEATRVFESGYMAEKIRMSRQREDRGKKRTNLAAATGKAGTREERRDRAQRDEGTRTGRVLKAGLSLMSFEQVVQKAFGEGTPDAEALVDWERRAAHAKADALQHKLDLLDDLFASLAGGKLKGEQLRFEMSDTKGITATDARGRTHTFSQLEAITATLMWRQEDGRRHMEGHVDDQGAPAGEWNYTQDFVDQLEDQLTDNAKAVRLHLAAQYGAEYDRLNSVFRQLYGVSLPRHANYSPISVAPAQSPSGQVLDPVNGNMTAAGLTPGSLKTRSQTAIAEPKFPDALQAYIAHAKSMEHWIAYAPFSTEAMALINARNVGNSVEAAAGKETLQTLRGWLDHFAQGGNRDAAAHLEANKLLGRMVGRAAAVALVGRVSVLAIQSTQLAAALAEMPAAAYMVRLAKLFSGRLDWSAALRSDYIQRRKASMPPVVQQALEGLSSSKPNRLKYLARKMGETISGADALFTAGTFAITYDYHLKQAQQIGVADPHAYARQAAERSTDRVAQPVRPGTRSLYEVTGTNPAVRIVWSFASDARQKLMLSAYALGSKKSKGAKARALAVTWLAGGLLASVIRATMRDLRDDDDDETFDEKNWDPKRLALASITGPFGGIPFLGDALESTVFKIGGEYLPEGNLFSSIPKAVDRMVDLIMGDRPEDLEEAAKDAETILSGAGLFFESASAASSFSHLLRDLINIAENLTGTD